MRRFLLITASALALATGGASLAHDYPGDQHSYNMSSSTDRVRFAQQELQEHGYYKGPVDGVLGPQTKQALQRFQRDNNLRVTASLDRATLDKLSGPESKGAQSSGPSGMSGQGSSGTSSYGTSSAPSYSPSPNPGAPTGDRAGMGNTGTGSR
jgi:peptidoglycan hydrolase-like protein with peptidoglycan-binding domain